MVLHPRPWRGGFEAAVALFLCPLEGGFKYKIVAVSGRGGFETTVLRPCQEFLEGGFEFNFAVAMRPRPWEACKSKAARS